MSLSLVANASALSTSLSTSFQGIGGVEPYVYSVLPSGAGGTIDPDSGVYTAPATYSSNPKLSSDVIRVTDDDGATATLPILITTPLGLVCDILEKELGLASGRVYLWDQKINAPTDNGLFIAVAVLNPKPFGNTLRPDGSGGGLDAVQSVNMRATLTLDIISRGPAARDRKEEVIMALNSVYSQSQQEANSFYIGKISTNFINLSPLDGPAIPYRFQATVNIMYFVKKTKAVAYFDEFRDPEVTTDP